MALSPMMQQYVETKKEYPDCILFYRLGDFYEMFFEDAILASKELELTLTGKDCGLEERAPMCGVPHHAVDTYLTKLVSKGYKVAIGEQVEDPKLAKGLVKREVVRVVTPGTNTSVISLDETKNNYIMSIVYLMGDSNFADSLEDDVDEQDNYGVAFCDVTTGDFFTTETKSKKALLDEIIKVSPSEIVCNNAFLFSKVDIEFIKNKYCSCISPLNDSVFDDKKATDLLVKHFNTTSLIEIGVEKTPFGALASGALLSYLYDTQKTALSHLTKITPYRAGKYMILDFASRRNLELTETLRDKKKQGSLLWVLDKTKTAMGARLLRSFVEQPLIDKEEIINRQKALIELNNEVVERDELREYLGPVYDLERLLSKISYQSANPRDLIALKTSLEMVPHIRGIIGRYKSPLFKEIYNNIDELSDITEMINSAINEDPPIAIKDGGIIKDGFNDDIDRLRKAKTEGKNWLAALEEEERTATGIKTLKIKYNKVFGYCIEITNSYKEAELPERYIRKQTLTNAERYITPRLKELEDTILNAQDRLFSLEYEIFSEIRSSILKEIKRIQLTAHMLAYVDALASLAFVADRNKYVCPKINDKGIINIACGRHPVVERMMENDMFVPNDTALDMKNHRVAIITGPNMAGKSTYMRQTAVICLMAQIGSFVPASSADICISDRIFTRVGASDDLASGQSTFMVEMAEVANILSNATSRSLIILDEIGRGTSTYDGLSIAQAVIEHIADVSVIGAKTLFATHYHELTQLEGRLKGVNNYCIAVKENDDDIVFLRKIIPGGADKSYGVQVAKLAGVPLKVTDRAKEILMELTSADRSTENNLVNDDKDRQLSFFDAQFYMSSPNDDLIDEIKGIDISSLTPIDALNILNDIKNRLS